MSSFGCVASFFARPIMSCLSGHSGGWVRVRVERVQTLLPGLRQAGPRDPRNPVA